MTHPGGRSPARGRTRPSPRWPRCRSRAARSPAIRSTSATSRSTSSRCGASSSTASGRARCASGTRTCTRASRWRCRRSRYPFDLLQLLRPDEAGVSFVLALHVPLAALLMMALARKGLGLSTIAAAGGAPRLRAGRVRALDRQPVRLRAGAGLGAGGDPRPAGRRPRGPARGRPGRGGGGRPVVHHRRGDGRAGDRDRAAPRAALLRAPRSRRMAAAARPGRGAGRAYRRGAGAGRRRQRARVRLPDRGRRSSHPIHPLTLAQVVVAGFYGDTAQLTERWWGGNFFPRGLSVLPEPLPRRWRRSPPPPSARAQDRGPRRRLAAVAIVALLLAPRPLGARRGGRRGLRDRPPLPLSVEAVLRRAPRGGPAGRAGRWTPWRAARAAPGGGSPSPPWPWAPSPPPRRLWPAAGARARALVRRRLLPARASLAARVVLLDWVLRDAATGGAVALAAGALAVLAWRGRVAPRPAALGVVALLAADLLRAGAGLNPGTSADFFTPSPEVARHHDAWREAGRVFTCDPAASAAYATGRAARVDHERWTFAVLRDTLAPAFNVSAGVPSALSPDLTMLVPPERLIDPRGRRMRVGRPVDRAPARRRRRARDLARSPRPPRPRAAVGGAASGARAGDRARLRAA